MRRILVAWFVLVGSMSLFAQESGLPSGVPPLRPDGGKIKNSSPSPKAGFGAPGSGNSSGFTVPTQADVKATTNASSEEEGGKSKMPLGPSAFAVLVTLGLLALVCVPLPRDEE